MKRNPETPRTPAPVRAIAVAVAAITLSFSAALPAEAHVGLNSMEPASGSVSTREVGEIALQFSADITNDKLTVDVYYRDGRPVPLTGEGLQLDGSVARGKLPALEYGTYVIVWSAIGTDGHFAAGQEHFSYGFEESGAIGDFQARMSSSGAEIAVRWGVYALLAFLVGLVWLNRTGLIGDADKARKYSRRAGAAAASLSLMRLALIGSRVGGDEGIYQGTMRVLTSWPAGGGWALMLGAIALLAARQKGIAAAAALVAFAWGDGLAGHLGSDLNSGVLVPLIALHLLGGGLWLGGPAAYLAVGEQGAVRAFMKKFSGWAAASFAVVAASGLALAQVRAGALTSSPGELMLYPYGAALVIKTAAIALVVLPLGGYQAASAIRDKVAEIRSKYEELRPDKRSEVRGSAGPRRALLVEVGALVAIVAAGVLLGTLPATPPRVSSLGGSGDLLAAPSSFEECMTGSAVGQLVCASNWFASVARSEGFESALDDLTNRWDNGDSWMRLNCHAIAHTIGRAAYAEYRDTHEAFRQGSDPCDYGYLHGVIEGASTGFSDEELRMSFQTMCEALGNVYSHNYRQCIHGLGHAAARRTNNDLTRAVEYCRAFWEEGMDTSRIAIIGVVDGMTAKAYTLDLCVTGVSMEWNMTEKAREGAQMPFGSPGTLMYECRQIDPVFQPGCMEYATSNIGGGADGYEVHVKVRDWCDENLADPFACYLSIGRGIIWSPGVSYEQAVDICTGGLGGEYEEACITWSLGSVATIELDADAIDDYCPYIPERLHHLCKKVQDNMRIQIEQTTRGFIIP